MLGACGDERDRPPQAALVVQVVDGDTVVLAGGIKVRVLGIDAPEMEKDGRPADFLAHKAKATLTELTLNRTVGLSYDRLRYDHPAKGVKKGESGKPNNDRGLKANPRFFIVKRHIIDIRKTVVFIPSSGQI